MQVLDPITPCVGRRGAASPARRAINCRAANRANGIAQQTIANIDLSHQDILPAAL